MSNHLKHETSPYLLQHADNPVDWFPWGKEAFEKARRENKPVFVSIGYSTCHWCHVMAHESFEDEEIGKLLNDSFVSVKVDREERPDIDSIYMGICQIFTGSGGWPLTVLMTADQEPFFAGTYFPKESHGQRIGLKELLLAAKEKWEKNKDELVRRAKFLVEDLQRLKKQAGKAGMELPALAVECYKNIYDEENGGFGGAPKFPVPHNLMFLLSYGSRYHDMSAIQMAEKTLRQMYRGGLFDHVGYGFSRYSTDERFLVPHFEKMLYDNALLILAYCQAYQVTKNVYYREIAEKTADYVLREMTSEEGGFYSAQDADSDGEEGKYYVFTPNEIISVLGETEGCAFNKHFNITKEGNFEGKNIPNLLEEHYGEDCLDSQLERLRKYRRKRSSLHLDDKVLTFWNSLMILAMCHLYHATGEPRYREAAEEADAFIRQNLTKMDKLFVSFRNGKRGSAGFLEDYASYLTAQLALYRITLKKEYRNRAEEICKKVLEEFKDEADGGFFLYGKENETLILKPKETYDGATPSGNSMMAWNLVRLAQLTEKACYEEEAVKQLDFMAADAGNALTGYSLYMQALMEYLEPEVKVTVVAGEDFDQEKFLRETPFTATIQILTEPTKEYPRLGERTTYYVCKDHCCRPPVCEWKEVR